MPPKLLLPLACLILASIGLIWCLIVGESDFDSPLAEPETLRDAREGDRAPGGTASAQTAGDVGPATGDQPIKREEQPSLSTPGDLEDSKNLPTASSDDKDAVAEKEMELIRRGIEMGLVPRYVPTPEREAAIHQLLYRFLKDDRESSGVDAETRRSFLKELRNYESPETLSVLIDFASLDPDPLVRSAAVRSLIAHPGDDRRIAIVLDRAMEDPSDHVRRNALVYLAGTLPRDHPRSPDVVAALRRAVLVEDEETSATAAFELRIQLSSSEYEEFARDLLAHETRERVRKRVSEALVELHKR